MGRVVISLTERQLRAITNILDEVELLCEDKTTEVYELDGKCISFPDVMSHEINLVRKALDENLNKTEPKGWHFKL